MFSYPVACWQAWWNYLQCQQNSGDNNVREEHYGWCGRGKESWGGCCVWIPPLLSPHILDIEKNSGETWMMDLFHKFHGLKTNQKVNNPNLYFLTLTDLHWCLFSDKILTTLKICQVSKQQHPQCSFLQMKMWVKHFSVRLLNPHLCLRLIKSSPSALLVPKYNSN